MQQNGLSTIIRYIQGDLEKDIEERRKGDPEEFIEN